MSKRKNKKNTWNLFLEIVIIIFIIIGGYITSDIENLDNDIENVTQSENIIFDLGAIPEYVSSPYVELNNNMPYFNKEDYTTEAFEKYSEWDSLGRSGVAYANICKETMPKEGDLFIYQNGKYEKNKQSLL